MCSPITHYLEHMFSLEGRTAVITGGGGVLCSGMAEAMAQAGGIMSLFGKKGSKDMTVLFLGVDNVRFRGIVRPGDTLRMEIETLQFRRNTLRYAGKCFVDDRLICEAEMLAMLGKKNGEE